MYFYKKIHQNNEDIDISGEVDDITMTNWTFLQYWLYAAFPHCHFLWNYLSENLPQTDEWNNQLPGNNKRQEMVPAYKAVDMVAEDGKEITILMYKYHAEYRMEGRELYKPVLSYHMVENLDNDTFFLLLPIVDVMIDYDYVYEKIEPDLSRRLSETALPKEYIKEVADMLKLDLMDAGGAEDEPLWFIWQETKDSLYGARWWPDAGEIDLFQKCKPGGKGVPSKYITVPEEEDAYLWGRQALAQWISSMSVD